MAKRRGKNVNVAIHANGDWEGYADQLGALLNIPNAVIGVAVNDDDHGDEGRANPSSNLEIAMYQEQGFVHAITGNWVGPRPVFGPTLDQNGAAYTRAVERAVSSVMSGSSAMAFPKLLGALELLANKMARDVKQRINDKAHTGHRGLEQSTIAAKGHDIAWRDSDRVYNAIEGVVVIKAELSDGSNSPGKARLRGAKGRFEKVHNR